MAVDFFDGMCYITYRTNKTFIIEKER
jgi:hypothetical protein